MLYRLEVVAISRSQGRDALGAASYRTATQLAATAAAAYRAGARLSDRSKTYDYRRKTGVVTARIIAPPAAPAWVHDREVLWQAVDRAEKRRDACLAREIRVTLPREVSLAAATDAVMAWVTAECVSLGVVADVAIHAYGSPLDPARPAQAERLAQVVEPAWPTLKIKSGKIPEKLPDGSHVLQSPTGKMRVYQPHAHVMLTTRQVTPDGFAPTKLRDLEKKQLLYRWRQSWEAQYNDLLREHGISGQVSCVAAWRQQAARDDGGIDRPREVACGGGFWAEMKDGQQPPAVPAEEKEDDMAPIDFNRALRRQRHEAAQAAQDLRQRAKAWAGELDAAMARIEELERQGVRFIRTEKGGLGYVDRLGSVTPEDRKQWAGRHAALLAWLARRNQAAAERDAAMGMAHAQAANHAQAAQQAEAAAHQADALRRVIRERDERLAQAEEAAATVRQAAADAQRQAQADRIRADQEARAAMQAKAEAAALSSQAAAAEQARRQLAAAVDAAERRRGEAEQALTHERSWRQALELAVERLVAAAERLAPAVGQRLRTMWSGWQARLARGEPLDAPAPVAPVPPPVQPAPRTPPAGPVTISIATGPQRSAIRGYADRAILLSSLRACPPATLAALHGWTHAAVELEMETGAAGQRLQLGRDLLEALGRERGVTLTRPRIDMAWLDRPDPIVDLSMLPPAAAYRPGPEAPVQGRQRVR